MKKILFSLSVTIVLASCASVEKHNLQVTKLHPIANLHEDIDNVYKQLKQHHPHLYQFIPKETLDFKFDSLKTAITTPMDSYTFYRQLAAVTKHIGQGHMTVSPPLKKRTKKERKEFRKMKFFDIHNLNFEYLEGKLLIVKARGKDSLLTGFEVLKLEEESPQSLIKKYKQTIASDGYNTTFHNRVVGKRFMTYYLRDKGRFDSITLTLKNSDSTFIKKYKRVLEDVYVKAKNSTKSDTLKTVKKIAKAEKKANKLKNKIKWKNYRKYGYDFNKEEYTRGLSFVGKDSSVAFLKIRGFYNGKYKEFYEESFLKLDSSKTETLVIDLRNNFGGRLKEIAYLYGYLTDKNYTMINPSEVNSRLTFLKLLMSNTTTIGTKVFTTLFSPIIVTQGLLKTSKKDGKIYYKFKYSKETEPNSLNFKGKIYVLINGNSFSASSILSAQLHGNKRATFVGEETGGAYNGTVAGFYKIHEASNTKVRARIGMMYIDTPFKADIDGHGVKPDIEILPTVQDRIKKRDPELDWVLKDIESKK